MVESLRATDKSHLFIFPPFLLGAWWGSDCDCNSSRVLLLPLYFYNSLTFDKVWPQNIYMYLPPVVFITDNSKAVLASFVLLGPLWRRHSNTQRRSNVTATSWRRGDVLTTFCVCWRFFSYCCILSSLGKRDLTIMFYVCNALRL